MFLRMQTQWVLGPMGGFVGLNYQSLDFLFRLYESQKALEIFEGLQLMELSVLRFTAKNKKG